MHVQARGFKDAKAGINTRFTRMRDAFKWADVDGSGTIDRSELKRVLDLLGVPMTEEQLTLVNKLEHLRGVGHPAGRTTEARSHVEDLCHSRPQKSQFSSEFPPPPPTLSLTVSGYAAQCNG